MNKLDLDYQNLLKDILENGVKKETRNGGTLSVFGRQIRHKMSDGFPLITTKKMYTKAIVAELLYFLRGNTSIEYLVDNDCNIWNGDLSKYHGVDVPKYKELAKSDSNLYEGGAIYPHQWRNFGSNDYNRKRIKIPFKTSFIKESYNLNSNDENVGKEYSTLEFLQRLFSTSVLYLKNCFTIYKKYRYRYFKSIKIKYVLFHEKGGIINMKFINKIF